MTHEPTGGGMSDINLNWGPGTFAFFLAATAWPGLVLGCALGAILWHGHRGWGGALGALLGFALNVAAFFVWAETGLSTHLDYWDALLLMPLRGAPGLAVGAAAG